MSITEEFESIKLCIMFQLFQWFFFWMFFFWMFLIYSPEEWIFFNKLQSKTSWIYDDDKVEGGRWQLGGIEELGGKTF